MQLEKLLLLTAKDGKYTVKLPADKAKDLTITQYVAK